MRRPKLSVLTTVHDSAAFVDMCIQSVLQQTYTDFQYIIVDDASTDGSFARLSSYAKADSRIRLIQNSFNMGPVGALNRGLAEVQGELLAILDADDIAHAHRFAEQVRFMDEFSDYGAVGSATGYIDGSGNRIGGKVYPTEPAVTRWMLLFGASLLHSASVYRSNLVRSLGGYSPRHALVCDYQLLTRIADKARIANLETELVAYRCHSLQLSSTRSHEQTGQTVLLQYALHHRWLGRRSDLGLLSAFRAWVNGYRPENPDMVEAIVNEITALTTSYISIFDLGANDQLKIWAEYEKMLARLK